MEFDKYGNLIPYEIIEVNLETFRQQFVEQFPLSPTRAWLFDAFTHYVNDIKQLVETNFAVWVNGSFVTQKLEPNDIDFVIFIDHQYYFQHEKALEQIRQRRFEPNSGVDGYFVVVYPESHRRRNWFESDRLRWFHDFGTSLANRPKGIIQLNF